MRFTERYSLQDFEGSLPRSTQTEIYQPGEELCVQNSPSMTLYYLESGEVSVFLMNDQHQIIRQLDNIHAGHFIGEMGFLQDTTRSATVVANKMTTVRVITEEAFPELVQVVPFWFAVLVDNLIDRLRASDEQLYQLKERVRKLENIAVTNDNP